MKICLFEMFVVLLSEIIYNPTTKASKREMTTRLFLVLICIVSYADIHAQRKHVITDMETGVPLRDVQVILDNSQEAIYTTYLGEFIMPDTAYSRLTIICPGYLRRLMDADEVTDTIKLIPTMARLHEVIIYGELRKESNFAFNKELERMKSSWALPSPSGGGFGFNLFSFRKRVSAKKREERMKAIENY